jgi:TolA-binding protein
MQQLDLMLRLPPKPKELFKLTWFLLGLVVWLIVLIVWAHHHVSSNTQLQEQVQYLNQQIQTISTTLQDTQKLQGKAPQNVTQQNQDLATLKEMINRLEKLGFHRYGLSQRLQALGQARVFGLWLKEINLRAGGEEVFLSGTAFGPKFVELYTKKLANTEAYAHKRFPLIHFNQSEQNQGVNFVICTDAEICQ